MNTDKLRESVRNWRRTPRGVLTNVYNHMKIRTQKYGYETIITLEELHNLFLQDPKFLELHKNWSNDNFSYYSKPSIDRIDPKKGYTADNVQVMTWRENRTKGDRENALRRQRPILAFNLDGSFFKRFESINQAVAELNLVQALVVAVCRGRRNKTGGYKFIYEDQFKS